MLDGDPLKLYYSWAQWRAGALDESEWEERVRTTRRRVRHLALGRGVVIVAEQIAPRSVGFVGQPGREVGELARDAEGVIEHLADRPALTPRRQIEPVPRYTLYDNELEFQRSKERSRSGHPSRMARPLSSEPAFVGAAPPPP